VAQLLYNVAHFNIVGAIDLRTSRLFTVSLQYQAYNNIAVEMLYSINLNFVLEKFN